MITLMPVLERWSADCPFWPAEQTDFYFAVPRMPTSQQVGAVVWTLIGRSVTADDLSITATDAVEAIEEYLTCDDGDFAPGGLRVGDDNVVIDPGCCVGLDEWRDWLRVIGGEVIDLGHDPDPLIEHRGPVVRVWKDGGQLPAGSVLGPDKPHIDIPRHNLPDLLGAVQQDLAGFLTALHPWAQGIRSDLADALAAAMDRRLQISEPLGI
ncbi:hypothetical protein BJY16_001775 [Actinoplanes octamycinicus]|uniref:Uncharacterized protein n=1 Tax=Actinoplanes octamycinicus TaxID=135948 RepID=A0A7W7M647_9ACTN|nr:hypothetical protein [Actinoplanes octamycinicus]MBB4738316.1 hypothetical protein [Actinoplanes octamycinicus]GIE57433.1 hypothetical protein Aoc01nite_28350 [Actinoplanes octamycinicus]